MIEIPTPRAQIAIQQDEKYNKSNSKFWFYANQNFKKGNIRLSYTEEQAHEYKHCLEDPSYFVKNYCKIINLDEGLVNFKLYKYQEEMFQTFNDNRFTIVLAARQSGKTQAVAAYFLWFATFNPLKTVGILANKGDTAQEIVMRISLMLENMPFFLQPGMKVLNKGSLEFDNGSRILSASTSNNSIRGKSLDCVPDYTSVCVLLENNDIYYTSLEKANFIYKNESKFIEEKHNIGHLKKYHFVYKTTNIINGKEYIGYHGTNDLDDGYLGSGKLLKRAVEKYGPKAFTREILDFFDDPIEALEYEKKIVNGEYVKKDNTYNLSIGGDTCILYGENNGFYGKNHSNETKFKIREKILGKSIHTEESKQKISNTKRSTSEKRMIHKDEPIPEGFKRGFLKSNENT